MSFSFLVTFIVVLCIKNKNGKNMEEYIDQIEKFLRRQMGQGEEKAFKESLAENEELRLLALLVVQMLKLYQKMR